MESNHIIDDAFINSIIGEGTRLSGEFDLNGLLRIDGDFSGTIRTKGKVLIGRNGRAECTIYAGTIVVGGVVHGNVFASEKVVVLSTGMVLGNVNTPRLIVEEGVVLHGTCTVDGHGGAAAGVRSGEGSGHAALPASSLTRDADKTRAAARSNAAGIPSG